MSQQNKFFETIKIDSGKIFNLDYHQKRIDNTFSHFFPGRKAFVLKDFLHDNFQTLTRAKLVYNNENIEVFYFDYKPKIINTISFVDAEELRYDFKFYDRSEIELLSTSKKTDEILIFRNGLLCDSSIANVAILTDGVWLSPKNPLLFGTTLSRYSELGLIKFAEITKSMVIEAEKIAFLNAMIDMKIYERLEILC